MGHGGPRKMVITPSRWQWHKYKDMLHFYTMLGLIPLGSLVFLINVFVGPAKLAPIPEDYTPKNWEYYSVGDGMPSFFVIYFISTWLVIGLPC